MNDVARTLVVGIGSDFGDDRLGPMVVDRLVARLPHGAVRRLHSPLDLLDHLEDVERLHVVDACRSDARPGTIRRIEWPAPELASVRFSGTHDVGLVAALHLAEQIGVMPSRATIWCVEAAEDAGPQDFLVALSQPVAAATEILADRIAAEATNRPVVDAEPFRHA